MADCLFRLEQLKKIADNDVEYQLLKAQINQGFPRNKHDLSELLHPYWKVREDLLVSNDGFVLKGTRLLISHELRKSILSDLHASHAGIKGTKARARLPSKHSSSGQRWL